MQKPVQFGDDIIIDADKVSALERVKGQTNKTLVTVGGAALVPVPADLAAVARAFGMELLPTPEGGALFQDGASQPEAELELAIVALEPFEDLAPCAAALDHLRNMQAAGTIDERDVATAQEVLAETGDTADAILGTTASLLADALIGGEDAPGATAPPPEIQAAAESVAKRIVRTHGLDGAATEALHLVIDAPTGSKEETVASLAHAIVTGPVIPLDGVTDEDPHDILAVSREGAQEAADNAHNEAVVARNRADASDALADDAEEHAADMERNAKGVAAVTGQVRDNVAADAEAEAQRLIDEAEDTGDADAQMAQE